MGIMLILAGMIFVGMNQLTKSSNARATRATLENLKAILAEYDTTTKLTKEPLAIWDGSNSNTTVACFYPSTPPTNRDIWRDPVDWPRNEVDTITYPLRAALDVCRNTGLAIDMMAAAPVNRKALQQLSSRTMGVAIPVWSNTIPYSAGNRVKLLSTAGVFRFFVCIQSAPTGNSPPASPATVSNQYWAETESTLLDAWGNPVLFVPAGGLRIYNPVTGTLLKTIQSTDRRPFFMSAGPDGVFGPVTDSKSSTGYVDKSDDNLYSFEN